MRRCWTPLIIRETQVKTMVSYHLTPVRMAVVKKNANNKARLWSKGNPCALLEGMYIGVATVGKTETEE